MWKLYFYFNFLLVIYSFDFKYSCVTSIICIHKLHGHTSSLQVMLCTKTSQKNSTGLKLVSHPETSLTFHPFLGICQWLQTHTYTHKHMHYQSNVWTHLCMHSLFLIFLHCRIIVKHHSHEVTKLKEWELRSDQNCYPLMPTKLISSI